MVQRRKAGALGGGHPRPVSYTHLHRIGRTGRAKRHGVAYTFIATITEGIRMDDIVRNTKAEVQRLRYDADGCLMLVEDGK